MVERLGPLKSELVVLEASGGYAQGRLARVVVGRCSSVGKQPQPALTARIRKLVVILNAMVKRDPHWSPACSTPA